MLIDSGPASAADDVASTIQDLGKSSVDWALFTHPHEDHIGGAPAVFDAFNIKEVWMPRTSHTTRAYENLLLAIEEEGCQRPFKSPHFRPNFFPTSFVVR
jgi:competence protein ComEC